MTQDNGRGTNLTRSGRKISEETADAGDGSTRTSEFAGQIDLAEPLGAVRRRETIADRVDFEAVRRELPTDWEVRPDIVQFGSEPVAETILLRQTRGDPRIVLKSVDVDEPAAEIEFYERSGTRASRRQTMTVDSLSEAIRVAINRVHQLDG